MRLSSVSATAFNRDGLDAPEYPCLTDWATVGVLLGMLHDAAPGMCFDEPDPHAYRCRAGMGSIAFTGVGRWPGTAVALVLLRVWGDAG
uniref:Uncharacterized protein n=1 Tax=viral metagenome TaxID=1070528 RepID=A0A6M3KQW8_9ZZZZ